jgi:hypothetical protein
VVKIAQTVMSSCASLDRCKMPGERRPPPLAWFMRERHFPRWSSLFADWGPFGVGVTVRNGNVHLSGVITNERSRQAAIVAAANVSGVKKVHDHLCWVEPMSGMYLNSEEDEALLKAN